MKIFTVIGARPQFIKSVAISRMIAEQFSDQIQEVVLHTGQHYDQNMSGIFFSELNISPPDYQLDLTGAQNRMVKMKSEIKAAIENESPDVLLVYGDTDSTLAGAQSGDDLGIHVVHVEAGLRSFNDAMPEEHNRVETDKLSTLLFVPTNVGMDNLRDEGFLLENKRPFSKNNPGVLQSGDIMYDNALRFGAIAEKSSDILQKHEIPNEYLLATVHRNYNTDNPERLLEIMNAFLDLAEEGHTIVIPLHPRTKKMMKKTHGTVYDALKQHPKLIELPPVSFLDIISLEKNAQIIITDSGGMQKEAFFFQKPCVILREETEWVELVENGNAILCGADKEKIRSATQKLLSTNDLTYPPFYGNGNAAYFICSEILKLK